MFMSVLFEVESTKMSAIVRLFQVFCGKPAAVRHNVVFRDGMASNESLALLRCRNEMADYICCPVPPAGDRPKVTA